MKDHPGGMAKAWVLAVCVATAAPAFGFTSQLVEYLHEDVYIQGKEIHAFADQGQPVTIVLGDFSLRMGDRLASGRDAVIWVTTRRIGPVERHDLVVYVEGDAKVLELGAETSDETILLTLHSDGRITASGRLSRQDLRDFPLYQRALRARRRGLAQPEPQPLAELAPDRRLPTDMAATAPAEPTEAAPEAQPPSQVKEPAVPRPVNYHAEHLTSKLIDQEPQPRRAIVLRGDVYLSQSDPDSEMFLELRSQSAVMFTLPGEDEEDEETPGAASLRLETGRETPEGVYLEGDVMIARGERYFRGPAAYYDFTTDRAIIIDPVFRTIQEQRNIPIFVRAKEARTLSAREIWFKDARVSSSDFYTPSYHIGASRVNLIDTTPYDEKGVRIGPRSWEGKLTHTTFNVRSVPILYWPYIHQDFTQGHTALRKAQIGQNGDFGFGLETEWHLFRLLGLIRPEGYDGRLELNYYERGMLAGARLEYDRPTYSGYALAYGLIDQQEEDDFGDERADLAAPRQRGRFLFRHKQFMAQDWLLQLETSYICDRNFAEAFFPSEFYAGKEQETLLYAKKQRDNWALTGLAQYRLNRFDTQTESAPDVAFYLLGEPLLRDQLSFFSESRAGLKRWRPANDILGAGRTDSDLFARLDTRNEVNWPIHLGPMNIVPYAIGRLTYWEDMPTDGERRRPYGQAGIRANMHIWRVYNNAISRLWDVNRLKHVITPEVVAFVSDTAGVDPDELFPMDADIERLLIRQSGVAVGLRQRLQTKRGPAGDRRTVDWMRLNILAGFYDNGPDSRLSNGDFFWYRPEYSLGRNHINGEYIWEISDSTSFLSDVNYDVTRGVLGHANAGLAVVRNPRLRYYFGWRALKDLDSSVGTFGFDYKINPKYSLSLFEQYDFDFRGGVNNATTLSIIRKLPRWYVGLTVTYIQDRMEGDEMGIMLAFWPEGIPEVRIGSLRMNVLSRSSRN